MVKGKVSGRGISTPPDVIAPVSLLNSSHIKVLKKLKRNKELVIIHQEKGSGIVVMNHSDYVRKLNDILEDISKIGLDSKQEDGVIRIEKLITKKLKELKKERYYRSFYIYEYKPIWFNNSKTV